MDDQSTNLPFGNNLSPPHTVQATAPATVRNGERNQTYLPVDFELTENDVYCGRGSENEGNYQFRKIIVSNLHLYSSATSKYEKSCILNKFVHKVKLKCTKSGKGVGFIGKDHKIQRYHIVTDHKAREKVAKSFRDAIQGKGEYSRIVETIRLENESTNKVVDDTKTNTPNSIDLPRTDDFDTTTATTVYHASMRKTYPQAMTSPARRSTYHHNTDNNVNTLTSSINERVATSFNNLSTLYDDDHHHHQNMERIFHEQHASWVDPNTEVYDTDSKMPSSEIHLSKLQRTTTTVPNNINNDSTSTNLGINLHNNNYNRNFLEVVNEEYVLEPNDVGIMDQTTVAELDRKVQQQVTSTINQTNTRLLSHAFDDNNVEYTVNDEQNVDNNYIPTLHHNIVSSTIQTSNSNINESNNNVIGTTTVSTCTVPTNSTNTTNTTTSTTASTDDITEEETFNRLFEFAHRTYNNNNNTSI